MDRGQCHILVIKSWSGWNPTVVCKLNICLRAALRGSGGGMAESGGGVGKVPSTHLACALYKEPSVDREASHLCTCSLSRRRWFHEPWMGDGLERMRVTPGKNWQSPRCCEQWNCWERIPLLNELSLDEDPDFSELRENKGTRQRRTLLKGNCRPPRNMEYCRGLPALPLSPFFVHSCFPFTRCKRMF